VAPALPYGTAVLRITRNKSAGTNTLKVEGRLAGDWVRELSQAVSTTPADASRVVLDLSDLSYVDPDGAVLLRTLRERGLELMGGSSFVSSLIDGGHQ
jgi:anti-anti-sigma regulatory factor